MKNLKEFLKAAGIRAARTTAQSAAAMIPIGLSITQVDWKTIAGTALLAGILSILTSISTGLPEVKQAESTS